MSSYNQVQNRPISSGIDRTQFDPGIPPQDDLFLHVNNKWRKENKIPEDKSSWGAFYELRDAAEHAVRDILQDPTKQHSDADLHKLHDAYAAFMDEDRLNSLGIEPIAQYIKEALACSSIQDLLSLAGRLDALGVSTFFDFYAMGDLKNPQINALYLSQSGIGLPDESYYRKPEYSEIRSKYVEHVTNMFKLTLCVVQPDVDAALAAKGILEIGTKIAQHHTDNVTARDDERAYNPTQWADFVAVFAASGVNIEPYFAALGAPQGTFDTIIVRDVPFVEGLANLLADESHLENWRYWLVWKIVNSYASLLTTQISKENFAFYGICLTGTPKQKDRWKRAVAHVESILGEEIGREYVARHFSPTAKEKMDSLVQDLLDAYAQSIQNLTWMSDETKNKALEKLSKFTCKIGHPKKWEDYTNLSIDKNDLLGNYQRGYAFAAQKQWRRVGEPVDKDKWYMTPQTVNAYYHPVQNEIVFPASILQDPFFVENRDDAANYGAIGAVIGHEIGHGFDDQGSKYDGDGKLDSWWKDADRKAFEQHTKSLIDQYGALSPEGADGKKVNGELTIGENIGDLGDLESRGRHIRKST